MTGAGKKGFTLLELLISILVIALLSVVVGGALSVAYRSVEKGERKIESSERMKATLALIDAQVQSAILVSLAGDEDGEYAFKGNEESFTFASNYSLWGSDRGYVQVTYRIETEPGGRKSLFLTENTIGIENEREVLLLKGIDKIRFEFLQSGLTESEGGWVSEWDDETTVPSKIRLEIVRGNRQISRVMSIRMQEPNTQQGVPLKTLPAKG
jgi:prepilin-type N-terminal cleavage/methylation domain-containing protein